MNLVTIIEVANITSISNSSISQITIRDIEFTEIGDVFYNNIYYSAKIGKKNKETFYDEQGMLNDINSSKEISSSILSQNPDDASQNPIALKNSNDPEFKKWENEQNLKYLFSFTKFSTI